MGGEAAVGTTVPPSARVYERWRSRVAAVHPAAWLTLLGVLTFTVVFGRP